MGRRKVGGAESLGEELRGIKQEEEEQRRNRRNGEEMEREMERQQGEKLGAWSFRKLYGINID